MSAELIGQLRAEVEGAGAELQRLNAEALAAEVDGTGMAPESREARLATARLIVAALNRLEPRDTDAITEYGDLRSRAQDVIALEDGGTELCRLTQRPLKELTDYGNAERIADAHAEELRFAAGLGWLAWDGTRWRRDENGAAMRLAKATVRAIRDEARELDDRDDAKRVFGHAVRSESAPRLKAALELAQSEEALLLDADALDADPYLLNVENGTLDLRTGELREHDPDDLLTLLAPVEYDPDAEAPTWAACLERVLPNPELRGWAQKLAGYCLTGDTSEQALVLVHGNGANGKTVVVETIAAILGEYAATADAATFLANRGAGVPNDLARLRGKRFVRASETEEGAQLARQLVKRVTGQDTISARLLYREFFEYRPAFKLALVTNNLPRVPAEDRATWRRLRVLPFDVAIPAAEQDRRLLARLRDELPGVLRWAVEGCLTWQAEGLGVPAPIAEATRAYRDGEDSVGAFARERCDLAPDLAAVPADVERAYLAYCEGRDLVPVRPTRELLASLVSLGVTTARSNGTRLWRGIALAQGHRDG